jgi:site-specific recombinase XerD
MKTFLLEEHLDRFLLERVEFFNHAKSGTKANEKDLRVFIAWLNKNKTSQINGHILIDFMAYLKNDRNNKPGTINRKISSIKMFIGHLEFKAVEGSAELNIHLWKRTCMPYSGPIGVLSIEDIKTIFDLIDRESVLGLRDFVLYSLMYRLGLRIGEARKIKLEDIDFQEKTIFIYGKGRKTRTLPINDCIISFINRWLDARSQLKNSESLSELFISKKGNAISERVIQENFQKIIKKTGGFSLKKVTPHSLRHAFASHAMESDWCLITLKAFMGHASIKSTEIYLHPSMKKMRACVNDHIAHELIQDVAEVKKIKLRTHQKVG